MKDLKLARLSPPGGPHPLVSPTVRRTGRSGDELSLAEKTVKIYVSSIVSKLEIARRAEVAAYLARHTTTRGTPG
jgi:hypothetical protein